MLTAVVEFPMKVVGRMWAEKRRRRGRREGARLMARMERDMRKIVKVMGWRQTGIEVMETVDYRVWVVR